MLREALKQFNDHEIKVERIHRRAHTHKCTGSIIVLFFRELDLQNLCQVPFLPVVCFRSAFAQSDSFRYPNISSVAPAFMALKHTLCHIVPFVCWYYLQLFDFPMRRMISVQNPGWMKGLCNLGAKGIFWYVSNLLMLVGDINHDKPFFMNCPISLVGVGNLWKKSRLTSSAQLVMIPAFNHLKRPDFFQPCWSWIWWFPKP